MAKESRLNAAFRSFWASDAVSQFTAAAVPFALPLLAVGPLRATPFQVGLVSALSTAAFLFAALPAGVLVDRARRQRDLMAVVDGGRFLLLLALGVSAWTGRLSLAQLYGTVLIVGVLTVIYDVTHQAYVPRIVASQHLDAGNARIAATASVAIIAAPALGGLIAGAVGMSSLPGILAVGFALSAALLYVTRGTEADTTERPARIPAWPAIREGLAFIMGTPILRAIVATAACFNLFDFAIQSMITVRIVNELRLPPAYVGYYFLFGGVGGILGAFASPRLTNRFGSVPVIRGAILGTAPFALLIPLAHDRPTFLLTGVGYSLVGFGIIVYNIAQLSLRQRLCPPGLHGRMNASIRFIIWGVLPLGALLGATVASVWSIRTALTVGALGLIASCLPVLLLTSSRQPVSTARETPTRQ